MSMALISIEAAVASVLASSPSISSSVFEYHLIIVAPEKGHTVHQGKELRCSHPSVGFLARFDTAGGRSSLSIC